jgi:hypothetical protein
MAANLLSSALQVRSQRVFLENPRTFAVSLSRESWRRLPLEHLVSITPTLNGPWLVFDDEKVGIAACAQERLRWLMQRYQRTYDVKKRIALARRIRKGRSFLVALAVGYTWPGNPPGWIEFADA